MAGVNAGCVLHALAAAGGVAAVLALWPPLFTLLQWGGAAYLAWLGAGLLWRACRSTPAWAGGDARTGAAAEPAAPSAATLAAPSLWEHFRAGLWTNVLNPKVLLFFLAFLPAFVPAASPSRSASFLLLGCWFVLQNTLLMSGIAVLAAQLRRWQTPGSLGPAA
jgi:threonine/homoserine/homoserine lactone efflux protein